jgi:hypothetical protein
MTAPNILWDGLIEKKSSTFFRTWNTRKMTIVGDECLYFLLNTADIRGIIKLVYFSTVAVSSNVVIIRTIGRSGKPAGTGLINFFKRIFL